MPLPPPTAERRERILAAAREIVGGRGWGALTMRELARQARVTVPTIYNLIGSKEEVLFAAVEDQTARFLAALEASRGRDPALRCLAVSEACARELLRLPRYYRTLLVLLATSDAAGAMRERVSGAILSAFRDALEGLDRAGALRGWVDRDALAQQLALHLMTTGLRWASGDLGDAGLRAACPYGTSLLLLGVCEGPARGTLERRAEALQRRLPSDARREAARADRVSRR